MEPDSLIQKECYRCETVKPIEEFSIDKRASDGRYSSCRECCNAAKRTRRANDPAWKRRELIRENARIQNDPARAQKLKEYEQKNKRRITNQYLVRKFGVTLEQKEAILASQDDRCAICGSEAPKTKRGWQLDHCHKTNAIRGVLCHNCNSLLGYAHDDPAILQAAIAYLARAPISLPSLEAQQELIRIPEVA